MKKLRMKLMRNSGESLLELLASVLVGSLSFGLLLTFIAAAARMDDSGEKNDRDYYKSLAEAEVQDKAAAMNEEGFPKKEKVKVILEENPGITAEPEVICFGGHGVYSYKLSPSDFG